MRASLPLNRADDPRTRIDPTLHQAISRYLAGDESALPDRLPQPQNYNSPQPGLADMTDLLAQPAASSP